MLKDLKSALQLFGKETVEGARKNLKKEKTNSSGNLYNSLQSRVIDRRDGFDLEFWMEEYGMFLDAGVYGSNPSLANTKKSKGKQKGKETRSLFTGNEGIAQRFSYKSKRPPLQNLKSWAEKNNINFKNKDGSYKTGNYNRVAFWLQKRIFAQGIAPTLFFTNPFLIAFNNLPDDILNAFDLYVNTVLKEDQDQDITKK
tara:strand:- start:41 stop:637 length:597 start_codon:yes stop_codon:yes gene_type:complete